MTAAAFPMAEFEDCMLGRLREANQATVVVTPAEGETPAVTTPFLGYVLRQIDNYAGQLDGGDPKQIAQYIRDLPAVWLCFEDAPYNETTGMFDASFSVVCVASNARNEKAARRGAGAGEVGVYQIARDVVGLLDGHVAVGGSTTLRCAKISVPFNANYQQTRIALALLTFVAHWDPSSYSGAAGDYATNTANPGGTAPGEAPGTFSTFDVAWEIPPFANPQPAIPSEAVVPAPGTYDAEDTIDVTGD